MLDLEDRPTNAMKFKWPWRDYQQRLLDELDSHLEDDKLHIVAAPGSGKTILGIEVFRRLGQPAVVLSPTLTIRDQWVARLGDFVEGEPDWVSTDLAAPGFFTSISYQALHTNYRESEQTDEVDDPPTAEELSADIARLERAGVRTLILDEAHHLRQAWWRALRRLVEGLSELRVVSLTATPPFDVVGSQWQRYEALCGPIDAEISVPELVRTNTLCPHQDYVWVVAAKAEEAEVAEYDQAASTMTDALPADAAFRARVQEHPWVTSEDPNPERVLDRPEFAFSLLVFLNAAHETLPQGLLKLLDCSPRELPKWDRRWCQALLGGYLKRADWPLEPEEERHRTELGKRLRSLGLLWRQELRISSSRQLERTLALATEKVGACRQICETEWHYRGDALRQAILTDFIGDSDFDQPAGDPPRLAAWPVMRELAGALPSERAERVALLTGRLAVVHQSLVDDLEARGEFSFEPLETLPEFRRVSPCGASLVRPLTGLLAAGSVQVLIGTRALLGEGWDAPAVNSLILATYVGTYVQTNQLRGRAIRTNSWDPDKTASVWHLAAVVPSQTSGLSDFDDLERRFDAFVGLSADGGTIRNGLGRLDLPPLGAAREGDLESFNRVSTQRLHQNAGLGERWRAATEGSGTGRVIPTVLADPPPGLRFFNFGRTLAYLFFVAVIVEGSLPVLLVESMDIFIEALQVAGAEETVWFLGAALLALAVFRFRQVVRIVRGLGRTLWLSWRHLPVDGSVRMIAVALLDALRDARLIKDRVDPFLAPPGAVIKDPGGKAGLIVAQLPDGRFSIALANAPFYEQQLFSDCLWELLGPIANPRYVLVREGMSFFRRRKDFHAVPRVLGANKDLANCLLEAWRRRVGPSELLFTRDREGRKLLLQARARSFSGALADRTERQDRWQ